MSFQKLGLFSLFSFLSFFFVSVSAQNVRPAAIPLAVRSPHFSAWLHSSNAPNVWPTHWTQDRVRLLCVYRAILSDVDPDSQVLGWAGLVRVDGQIFEWLGLTFEGGGLSLTQNQTTKVASLQTVQVTPTRTMMTYDIGGLVSLNVTFLSPIEPQDAVLQSLEFTYVYVDVESKDGKGHSVQLYQDLSGGTFFIILRYP